MTHNNQTRSVLSRGLQNLICRVTNEYMCAQFDVSLLGLSPQALEQRLVMGRRRFDGGLRLDFCRRLRGTGDRHDRQARTGERRKVERVLERRLGIAGTIVTDQDMRRNHQPSRSPIVTARGTGPAVDGVSIFGSRYRGTKNAFATNVGTTALPITAAITYEYCV